MSKELEEINELAVKAYGLDKAINLAKEAIKVAANNLQMRTELLAMLEKENEERLRKTKV